MGRPIIDSVNQQLMTPALCRACGKAHLAFLIMKAKSASIGTAPRVINLESTLRMAGDISRATGKKSATKNMQTWSLYKGYRRGV